MLDRAALIGGGTDATAGPATANPDFRIFHFMNATEAEMGAAEMVYERETTRKVSFGDIPSDDQDRILKEIRARMLAIEQFATHDMLVRRIGEGRRTPRRHMLVALAALIVFSFAIAAIVSLAK